MAPKKTDDHPIAITPIEYGGLQAAFDHFNTVLFEGSLVDLFITYQRRAHSRGYFSADRFSGRIDESGRHELALNPDHFFGRSDEEICSTLVHEQVHVWQHHHGKPSARGYHNKEWAAKMKAVGLWPSNTGAPGGKQTGQQMSHYIVPGGAFAKAFAKLAATGWKLNLQSAHQPGAKGGKKNKITYVCPNPSCPQETRLWASRVQAVRCDPCDVILVDENIIAAVTAPVAYEPTAPTLVVRPLSYEPILPAPIEAEPPQRKRGRPKGSKNKPKADAVLSVRCKANTAAQAWPTEGQQEPTEAAARTSGRVNDRDA